MSRLAAAEDLVRRGDFEAAGRLLGASLGLEELLRNAPAHDLLYSTPARGRRIPETLLRRWKRAAGRRGSGELWALVGAAQVAAGEGRKAEATLSLALGLLPGLLPARLLRAAAILHSACMEPDNSRRRLCLKDLDAVLAQDPSDTRALRLRAEVKNDLEDFEGAREDLERAIALEPGNGWARAELADLLCDSGRFSEAWPLIESLRRQSRGQPVRPSRTSSIGPQDGRCRGQPVRPSRTSIIGPQDGRCRGQGWYWALRGRALATSGRAAEGLKALSRAVRLSPRMASAVAWRGEAFRVLGRFRRALADFDRAIRMDPGFVYAYEWRGRLLLMLGRPAEALRDLNILVRKNPRHRYGPALRGEALFKLGRYREAFREFEKVRPLDPRRTWNPAALEGRMTTRAEREAAFWSDLERAKSLSPRDPFLWFFSSRLKSDLGRRDEGLEELKRAVAFAGARLRGEALAELERVLRPDTENALGPHGLAAPRIPA